MLTDFDDEKAQGALIINDVMAERYWPGEDPIGKRITFTDSVAGPFVTIVGIVDHVRQVSLNAEPYPQMYQSYRQFPVRAGTVIVRTTPEPMALVSAVRAAVSSVDQNQPLYNVRTMEEILSASISRQRLSLLLIVIVTCVALFLASIGIYGVLSFTVSQRIHEIGVRMALGAKRSDIIKMMLGQTLGIVWKGLAIGLLASWALSRVMSRFVYGINADDPLTFIGVSTVLVCVALLSSYVPARRATRVSPVNALRYE
jgi:putative ABC transport system permease protein